MNKRFIVDKKSDFYSGTVVTILDTHSEDDTLVDGLGDSIEWKDEEKAEKICAVLNLLSDETRKLESRIQQIELQLGI